MYFRKGLEDGIPVALGYFSVSIAFGLMAVQCGCSWFEAVLISFTNLTSAGQFAGVTVMAGMGTYVEMAVTQVVINSRYALMAIALSQKTDRKFKGIWRLILGFAITDEIFAIAVSRDEKISRRYFAGLASLPILGWSAGTFCGAVLGNIMPDIVTNALGVALYGMFVAVVVPKTRESRHVLIVVLIAVAISSLLYYVPVFSIISSGFAIIICAVIASAVGALLFPVSDDSDLSEESALIEEIDEFDEKEVL